MKIVIIIVVIIMIIIIIYFAHECNSHVTVVQKAITMSRNSKVDSNTPATAAPYTECTMSIYINRSTKHSRTFQY